MSTGLPGEASGGSHERSAATVSLESSGTCNPRASHVSAHWIASPPAFVTIATLRPVGTGWFASSVATSNISSSVSVRITPCCRKTASTVRSFAASSAPGVRGRRPRPRGAPPALDRDDRFARPDAAREPPEAPRVAEGFEIEQHHVGAGILVPIAQEVVGRDVGLVPDADERGEPHAERARLVHHGQTERTGLRHEPDVARGRPRGDERAVQADVRIGVGDAHAVGTDQAHAERPAGVDERLLTRRARFVRLAEPGGDHDEGAHALAPALPRPRR